MSRLPRVPLLPGLLVISLAVACLLGGYALGLRGASGSGPRRPSTQLSADDQRAFGVVWETLAELERTYYRRDQLNADALAAAAARGMLSAVGDPYTTLSSGPQSEMTASELRGTFEGVGLELDRGEGRDAPLDAAVQYLRRGSARG